MSLTAYATTSTNQVGADAGISVFDNDANAEIARETSCMSLDDGSGDLDYAEADAMLAGLGYDRTGSWATSGGQWAATVSAAGA